ncbi:MAG: APC family permease [Actinomycetota bacterium]
MAKTQAALKRMMLGRPMSSGELEHTLLPKWIALPVFSSDALSSVAYATQEILLVLGAVSLSATGRVVPISIAVAVLLALVVISYRQTVRAYPQGGGAYRVSHENLGVAPGLLAASALLLDYILTVAVSITAGTEAITTAIPSLEPHKVQVAFAFILFVGLLNLRGVKESGVFFAIPTYGFILSVYALLVTGAVSCLGGCPQAENAGAAIETMETLTPFLILKAFSAGTTALTGVEAISDGVPAFRYPQSKNAATTLAIMGAFSISMFIGVSLLADGMNVLHTEHSERTVLGEIAHTAFGGGIGFYTLQIATAAILILAANTAYQDFPRLSSILATDRFMPRQFMNRGDRLVFSNGILILSVLAGLLIFIFDAELNSLIQLYLVGVFISFTLSQSGMVMHWRKFREPGWRRSAAINGFGASLTAIVLGVVVATKFLEGAWIVISAIPILMYLMYSIHTHYSEVRTKLDDPTRLPVDKRAGHQNVIIFVHKVDAATARAVGYVRSIRPSSMRAVALEGDSSATWKRLAPEIPLDIIEPKGTLRHQMKDYLRERRRDLPADDFLTFIIPEVLRSRSTWEILRSSRLHRLKASLLREPGVQVLDVPIVRDRIVPHFDEAQEPARNTALVLVSAVHNATLHALEYAETLRPSDLRAISFGLDQKEAGELAERWLSARIPHPLEIEDSPFRDIATSLGLYLKQFNPNGRDRVVTIVMPEAVVAKTRHQLLHNQTALIVKRRMLFEDGVVVVSVPYHV